MRSTLRGAMMILTLTSIFGAGCDRHEGASAKAPEPQSAGTASDADKPETAIFAGGCFWCIEGAFRQLNGVTDATSGYAGGKKELANYDAVCTGLSGHAEAVRITYDPAKITFGDLLRVFFTIHDPTTLNRQDPDEGPQYRSAIFYLNDDQKAVAQSYIQQLEKAKVFPDPIVTALEPIKPEAFYPAEDYHQNYVACHLKNPSPYLQYHALPMVEKVRADFKDRLKPGTQNPS